MSSAQKALRERTYYFPHLAEDYSLRYYVMMIDNAIQLLLSLGKGACISNTKVHSAFKIIPVHPIDWKLLGMCWKGLYFFEMVLPFGLGNTSCLFEQFSLGGFGTDCPLQTKHFRGPTHPKYCTLFVFIALLPPRSLCSTRLCKLLTLAQGRLLAPLHNNKNVWAFYWIPRKWKHNFQEQAL